MTRAAWGFHNPEPHSPVADDAHFRCKPASALRENGPPALIAPARHEAMRCGATFTLADRATPHRIRADCGESGCDDVNPFHASRLDKIRKFGH